MDIFNKQNYHFIGIGGIGISAIAKMLALQGKKVSGSDMSQSEITDDLVKLGVKIYIDQKSENIAGDTEVVIHTVAIPENNPELKATKERGLICKTYPEALGELSKQKFTIAISGTHGKTTTTAMIGHILKKAGLDPTIVVGSKMLSETEGYTNFIAGKSQYLVVEACEYKRSFLNLHPKILVILNIDADHLDYYKDLNDIKNAFAEMESRVPTDGFVIKQSEYTEVSTPIELLIPGAHNISNAQAAIKTVEKLGISNTQAAEYLKDFKGTWRRLEYKGEKEGNIYFDDYAHHPTEIKASLSALKAKYPERKLVCVFEPHQQSRTRLFFDEFVEALKIASQVFIAPIFITREVDDHTTTNKKLAEEVNKFVRAGAVENVEELKEKITPLAPLNLRRGPNQKLCVVLMGAGDIYKWTANLLK